MEERVIARTTVFRFFGLTESIQNSKIVNSIFTFNEDKSNKKTKFYISYKDFFKTLINNISEFDTDLFNLTTISPLPKVFLKVLKDRKEKGYNDILYRVLTITEVREIKSETNTDLEYLKRKYKLPKHRIEFILNNSTNKYRIYYPNNNSLKKLLLGIDLKEKSLSDIARDLDIPNQILYNRLKNM